jgi:hypothetical protein
MTATPTLPSSARHTCLSAPQPTRGKRGSFAIAKRLQLSLQGRRNPHQVSPRCTARIAAAVRERTPSLVRTPLTCRWTVRSLR